MLDSACLGLQPQLCFLLFRWGWANRVVFPGSISLSLKQRKQQYRCTEPVWWKRVHLYKAFGMELKWPRHSYNHYSCPSILQFMHLKQKNAKFYSAGSLLPLPSCSAFWEVKAGEGKEVVKSQDCVASPIFHTLLYQLEETLPFLNKSGVQDNSASWAPRISLWESRCFWITVALLTITCQAIVDLLLSLFSPNTVLRNHFFYFSFTEQQRRHKRVKQLSQCDSMKPELPS